MTRPYTLETLIEIAEGDRTFVEELFQFGILEHKRDITREDLERTRVACSLVKELEVNLAGAQIIIRMRERLLETRARMSELIEIAEKITSQSTTRSK